MSVTFLRHVVEAVTLGWCDLFVTFWSCRLWGATFGPQRVSHRWGNSHACDNQLPINHRFARHATSPRRARRLKPASSTEYGNVQDLHEIFYGYSRPLFCRRDEWTAVWGALSSNLSSFPFFWGLLLNPCYYPSSTEPRFTTSIRPGKLDQSFQRGKASLKCMSCFAALAGGAFHWTDSSRTFTSPCTGKIRRYAWVKIKGKDLMFVNLVCNQWIRPCLGYLLIWR